MGASGLQRSICGAAASAAVEATSASSWRPSTEDVAASGLVILWGHNPASTGPHFMPMLREAQSRGAHVVVIDPRRTLTARSAERAPAPATGDRRRAGARADARHLRREPARRGVAGGEHHRLARAARAARPPSTRERVAGITGLAAETIVALARRYADTRPALIKIADGMQRHGNGGQTVRAICCLPAIVGQIGVRGGGFVHYSRRRDRLGPGGVGRPGRRAPADAARGQHEPPRRGAGRRGDRPADHVALRLRRQPGRVGAQHRPHRARACSARTCSPWCTTCS